MHQTDGINGNAHFTIMTGTWELEELTARMPRLPEDNSGGSTSFIKFLAGPFNQAAHRT